ncbi:MAG: ribonuclease HII [Cyclobacterium sp.]|uniref:ribonuclease HII n=1 Tax=unclassified Cyclobacterium TaxID=2615055 RepID=UPI0013D45C43|nr:ribonuclease HII [Cyclobacterium sp. SYSU L10401]
MLLPHLKAERKEAGCDEVGRGCLCGPVVAAAVILPPDYANEWINDSKKINKSKRTLLTEEIKEQALAWAIGFAEVEEIDQINILNASFLAMHRAIDGLKVRPEHLLIDGNRYKPKHDIPFDCVIKGDGKYASIAAASILAKTYRDQLMIRLAREYPGYGWEKNVGYPTKKHREGIQKLGPSPLHRKSFRLLPKQLNIDL